MTRKRQFGLQQLEVGNCRLSTSLNLTCHLMPSIAGPSVVRHRFPEQGRESSSHHGIHVSWQMIPTINQMFSCVTRQESELSPPAMERPDLPMTRPTTMETPGSFQTTAIASFLLPLLQTSRSRRFRPVPHQPSSGPFLFHHAPKFIFGREDELESLAQTNMASQETDSVGFQQSQVTENSLLSAVRHKIF